MIESFLFGFGFGLVCIFFFLALFLHINFIIGCIVGLLILGIGWFFWDEI